MSPILCSRLVIRCVDKAEAEKLAKTVEDASEMLNQYNESLAQELLDRKRLFKSLAPFINSQKERLAESQQKLVVCNHMFTIQDWQISVLYVYT